VKQSRLMSLMESVANNAIAFIISIAANQLVLPLFGLYVTLAQSIGITVAFTLISIVRGYIVRRVFETWVR
jgi:putative flippase GtrA